MLFAAVTLGVPGTISSQIQPNHRIPDGTFTPEQIERFIKKGYVREIDSDPEPQAVPVDPTPIVRPTKGKWDFELETIKGDTLDVLNMKAREHAAASNLQPIEPFEDLSEALAFMTMDA
jgi:hypothetical protein